MTGPVPRLTNRSVRRSSCDFFVIVAPAAKHADTGCLCNAETYRKRSWCRAEVMSCWARNGRGDMWLSSSDGLRPLDEATLREAIDVAGGDLTCCRLHHARGDPCDREALVLPMLGLYAEIFRHRHAPRGREAYEFLAPIKESLFPRTFSYSYHGADGGVESAEETLFGDLLRAVETAVELSEADASNPIWRRALPDLSPGSTAQRHSHHLRTSKGAAASTRQLKDPFRGLPAFAADAFIAFSNSAVGPRRVACALEPIDRQDDKIRCESPTTCACRNGPAASLIFL